MLGAQHCLKHIPPFIIMHTQMKLIECTIPASLLLMVDYLHFLDLVGLLGFLTFLTFLCDFHDFFDFLDNDARAGLTCHYTHYLSHLAVGRPGWNKNYN